MHMDTTTRKGIAGYDGTNFAILLFNIALMLGMLISIIMVVFDLFKSHYGPSVAWLVIGFVFFAVIRYLVPNPVTIRHQELIDMRQKFGRYR